MLILCALTLAACGTRGTRTAGAHETTGGEANAPHAEVADLLAALHWREDATEEQAIEAGQALSEMTLSAADRGEVIEALGMNYERIEGARGDDNRMRIAFLRSLGALGDRRATPWLARIMLRRSPNQSFLLNRLAAQQLSRLDDPEAAGPLVQALFFYAEDNPNLRMNDAAEEGLVRLGHPALAPLLRVLRGEDSDANATVTHYIAAVVGVDEHAAGQMEPELLTASEALYTLGELGDEGAREFMVSAAGSEDVRIRVSALVALVRLGAEGEDVASLRELALRVFASVPDSPEAARMRMPLVAAMRRLYDPMLMPFFIAQVSSAEAQLELRAYALDAAVGLANAAEAAALRTRVAGIASPEAEALRNTLENHAEALSAAAGCDEDRACWLERLTDASEQVATKAAEMLGRVARGDDLAVRALVQALGDRPIRVRLAAMDALGHVATEGSPEAVARIDALEASDGDSREWSQLAPLAHSLRARLLRRATDAAR